MHSKPWYKEAQPHEALFNTVSRIDEAQSYRYDQNLENVRFYSNRLVTGLYGADYALQDTGDRLKLNVVQSVIDAANAHLATNRPRPIFLTDDGDYSARRKAKKLTRFVDGAFHHSNQYGTSLDVFRDGSVFGTGFCKIYAGRDGVCSERVFADAIVVDDVEGRLGSPRNMYEHREVSREVLLAEYPKKAAIIEDASKKGRGAEVNAFARLGQLRDHHDPVTVLEAWHLPSYPGAADGRHVICTDSGTLFDEPWERSDFPFVCWRWKQPVLGFYGIGIVEELKSIQIEINYLLQKIQQLMNLQTSQIWLHESSKTSVKRITNLPWQVNYYSGQPPMFVNPSPVAPEYFAQIERLYQRAFEQVGISQLAAQSQKPAGLNSGTALRTYNDIGNKRFQETLQRWEHFHVEAARKYIRAAKELDERLPGGFEVLSAGRKTTEMIKWSDVDLEESRYVMRPFPTSLLPDTPAGKIETLKEIRDLSPTLADAMIAEFQFPDAQNAISLITAPVDMVEKLLERMIDFGEYRPPDSYMPLQFILERGRQALLKAELDGVPQENLELVRRFITESEALLRRSQQQMQPQPQPPASAPLQEPLNAGAIPGPI